MINLAIEILSHRLLVPVSHFGLIVIQFYLPESVCWMPSEPQTCTKSWKCTALIKPGDISWIYQDCPQCSPRWISQHQNLAHGSKQKV